MPTLDLLDHQTLSEQIISEPQRRIDPAFIQLHRVGHAGLQRLAVHTDRVRGPIQSHVKIAQKLAGHADLPAQQRLLTRIDRRRNRAVGHRDVLLKLLGRRAVVPHVPQRVAQEVA